jgi:putative nucleotidyltransferase with HDIG domain
MSGSQRLTRSERVAALELPPGYFERTFGNLRRSEVLSQIALCFLAAIVMWVVTGAWAPPFSFRSGYTPPRNIDAKIAFSVVDPVETEKLRKQKRSETKCVYVHDSQPLKELRSALKNQVFKVLGAKSYEDVKDNLWESFLVKADESTEQADEMAFNAIRTALADDQDLTRMAEAVQRAFQQFEENGLIEALDHEPEDGSQISILVYPVGKPSFVRIVDVQNIIIAQATADLRQQIAKELELAEIPAAHVGTTAQLIYNFLTNQGFPTSLAIDEAATQLEYDKELRDVAFHKLYKPGDTIAEGGTPLTLAKVELLRREYASQLASMSALQMICHSLADLGMYVALYILCGTYIYHYDPRILTSTRRLATVLVVVIATVLLCRICAVDYWRAEVLPLAMFGITIAIAYSRELALILSAAVSLIVCLSLGLGLVEFVLLTATTSAAILSLNRVRSRTKLIYIGLGAAVVAMLTTIGIGTMTGYALGPSGGSGLLPFDDPHSPGRSFIMQLASGAIWYGFCAILAGVVMTGLLPFIERLFDVQTDISLLELGDAAHPLLQELARRAPGTYNHSINVASMAEAAAESIGANGLLVRVGAYFHDIGKMFKPGYFVENQAQDSNLHESLLPAMSTLVIIAHVKDGADLARAHHLPRSIIDFIEQHHGTTLVEYFYEQATRQQQDDPDKEDVQESSFRYPGPKPQTPEAGVLMLADAVESASRTLVDPTPARIESLVHSLAMKRLLDDQFDECGITLKQLSTIEESLIKTLTAVYHGRVKYPDQQTA